MKKTILTIIIFLLLITSALGADYTYEVQKVRFNYSDAETYEQELSGITIVLRDAEGTLDSVSIGRIKNIPEGTITSIQLYLYRAEDDIWDKDGWQDWNFLNNETLSVTQSTYNSVSMKLQWNGLSYDVIDPVVE